MAESLRILCVHGVGDHHSDSSWQDDWRGVIRDSLTRWNASTAAAADIDFVVYDDLFQEQDLGMVETARAMAKLMASGVRHGVGDWFGRRRGLFDIPERIRWTAGMVVQWVENDELREQARSLIADKIKAFKPHVVAAHSLGSLICYDTFASKDTRDAIAGRTFISFGSQIGNPFVRGAFGGRLVSLDAGIWFHLYNPQDDAFTGPLSFPDAEFRQVETDFDVPGILDHDAREYLSHDNAVDVAWRYVAQSAAGPATVVRTLKMANDALESALRTTPRQKAEGKVGARTPNRRALLVGINDYPDESVRLEGCVNDVFLVSSVLQELDFTADDIRVVFDERATADGIRDRLAWLLGDVKDGDLRVFFYSGHGAQINGYGIGETVDRQDECLVPYDFDWSPERSIIDDELFDLYSQLPYGAQFAMILDCCHSGGMVRDGGRRVRGLNPPDDVRHRAMKWNPKQEMWEPRQLEPPNASLADREDSADYVGRDGFKRRLGRAVTLRTLSDERYDAARKLMGHEGPYLPMIFQACDEQQFAAEYRHGATSYGAFTYAMAKELRRHRKAKRRLTWSGLVKATAKVLKDLKYEQMPKLAGPGKLCNTHIPW